MQIGAYSFGDTQRNADGTLRSTAEAIRNLFEVIVHADAAGLDYFAVGEHHTLSMSASSPGTILAAAAGATTNIILGSGVSVISTDDPVRIFQQFATAEAQARFYPGWQNLQEEMGRLRGWPAPSRGDFGGLPQEHLLEHLTLLATEVKPRVTRLLAQK